MNLKLCVLEDGGHGLFTYGKRCMKSLDPNETREWILNNRVIEELEDRLDEYENVVYIRLDDPTGKRDVPLSERVRKANALYKEYTAKGYVVIILSIHHNAGIYGRVGGGIVTYTDNRKASDRSKEIRDRVYDAVLAKTGLKGNRVNPKTVTSLYILNNTDMPGCLSELGFMDSPTDVPVILTKAHAEKCADGFINFLVNDYNLKKKAVKPTPKPVDDLRDYGYTTADLNVRSGRSTGHKILTVLKKGTKVEKLYLANGWWSIAVPLSVSDKGYGFVSADWISLEKEIPEEAIAPKVQYATVNAKPHLNVRSDAGGKKIGILEDTSEVWIMGSKPGWYKVAWGPNQGWVSASYINLI